MVDLDPEHRVRDRPDVADGLLRGLAAVREHVDLDRPSRAVLTRTAWTPASRHSSSSSSRSSASRSVGPTGRSSDADSPFDHSVGILIPSREDPAPPGNTAYGDPTTVREAAVSCVVTIVTNEVCVEWFGAWKLSLDLSGAGRQSNPGGGQRRRLGGDGRVSTYITHTVPEAKRSDRRATAMPAGERRFQGVS